MDKEILTFGNIKIEKKNLYHFKSPIFLEDAGEKNLKQFIGYMYDDYKIKPLHITLPKTSAYVKSYDGQTNYIYFLKMVEHVLKMVVCCGNMKLFGINSAQIFKKI